MNIVHTLSDSGDDCHVDIEGVKNNQTEKFVKGYLKGHHVFMCCDGVEKQLSQEQYEDLHNNLC